MEAPEGFRNSDEDCLSESQVTENLFKLCYRSVSLVVFLLTKKKCKYRSQPQKMCRNWVMWRHLRIRKRKMNDTVRNGGSSCSWDDCRSEAIANWPRLSSSRRKCITRSRGVFIFAQPFGRLCLLTSVVPFWSTHATPLLLLDWRPWGCSTSAQTNKLFHYGGVCAHICLVLTGKVKPLGFLTSVSKSSTHAHKTPSKR